MRISFFYLFTFVLFIYEVQSQTPPDQVAALEDIYNEMNGANWYTSSNWLTGDPCNNYWYGVYCNNDNISSIYLANNNVIGTFPASFSNLQYVQEINMAGNGISGPIDILTEMTLIYSIQLSTNPIASTIPNSISNLKGLSEVSIDNAQLTGTIPEAMGDLSLLQYLDLSINALSGTIPEALGGARIISLDLAFNQLSGTIPSSLFNAPELKQLELDGNLFGGELPSLENTTLSDLSISNNAFTSFSPNLGKLTFFNISRNKLSGEIPEFTAPYLQTLDLSYNEYTSIDQFYNSPLPEISSLYLNNNQISGTFSPILYQRYLYILNLSYNQFEGTIPPIPASTITSLGQLYIQNNSFSGTIPPFKDLYLLYIDMSNNLLTGNGLDQINFSYISNLNFSNNMLTGTIPTTTSYYYDITLDLGNNQFYGYIPLTLFTNDYAFRYLDLHNNQFSGTLPYSMAFQSTLQSLFLQNNTFTGKIPEPLLDIPSLTQYNLTLNYFFCPVPSVCSASGNSLCLPCVTV